MFRLTGYTAVTAAVAATVLLSACGGGGSDDGQADTGTPPPAATSAEGFWVGKSSTGFDVNLAVLENGDTWGVYARSGVLYGALRGTTTSANGTLSGTGAEVDLSTGAIGTGAYTGTYAPKSSLQVRLASNTTFIGNYASVYDQPASLSAVAGTYTGSGVATGAPVQSAVLNVSASGVVSSPPSLDCSAAGTVKPSASGKNIFDLQITFNGTNCALGNGASVSGVVYYENGALIAMGLRPGSQTTGFIFTGRK